jgi:hypothetical protein
MAGETNGYTSLSVKRATKDRLEGAKIIPDETFESLLNRLLDMDERSHRPPAAHKETAPADPVVVSG